MLKLPQLNQEQMESTVANNATTNKGKVQTAQQKQTYIINTKNAKIAAQEKSLTTTQVKNENAQLKSSKDGIVVFIKAANFGSTAELVIASDGI